VGYVRIPIFQSTYYNCQIISSELADEEGTLERLKALRRELLEPKIAEYHGRIVKTTGDGLLVEFASIVDAVRCATEVQRGMIDREGAVVERAPSTVLAQRLSTRAAGYLEKPRCMGGCGRKNLAPPRKPRLIFGKRWREQAILWRELSTGRPDSAPPPLPVRIERKEGQRK
jgi:hypothetical protein